MTNGTTCKKALRAILISAILAVTLAGCNTIPSEVPEDWSVEELNQRAQEFSDKKNYRAAVYLYETLIERYGSSPAVRISSEFEIGHIKVKQRNWTDAQARLETVLKIYEENPQTNIPQEYKKLAQIDLDLISNKK